MRISMMLTACLLPVLAMGQYIGNPAGKAVPLSLQYQPLNRPAPFASLDFGVDSFSLDAEYNVDSGATPYVLTEKSRLNQVSAAFSMGANIYGFEFDAKIGGFGQEIEEESLSADPLDDAGGALFGFGARWGFSPVKHLRLGLGGQFTYSWSKGDTYVRDGSNVWREEVEMDLYNTQLFTGASLDLVLGNACLLSPYVGLGLEFIRGDLSYHSWDWHGWEADRLADFDEDHVGFVFGGLDFHFDRRYKVGLEVRGKHSAASGFVSFGIKF